MLCRIADLQLSRILATDGEVGKVRDAYFDEVGWIVRYLVIDTSGWLSGRQVLVDPRAAHLIDQTRHTISVCLTRAQIESSPEIDTDKPVSQQHASQLSRYYGHVGSWSRSMPWEPVDTHLRSAREVLAYTVITADGHVGQLKDLMIDDESWALRYLVVQSGSWLVGRRVLVNAECVRRVDWVARSLEIDRTREQMERGRAFGSAQASPGNARRVVRPADGLPPGAAE